MRLTAKKLTLKFQKINFNSFIGDASKENLNLLAFDKQMFAEKVITVIHAA